ncbi:hypothetical protein UlMin_045380 [Ulmus minor]
MDRITKRVLAQGQLENGLYKLPVTSNESKQSDCSSIFNNTAVSALHSRIDTLELWHSHVGHASPDIVHRILKDCKVSVKHNKDHVCSSCQYAKNHRLPFHLSNSRAASPLDLIYTDIWGPAPLLSTAGARYFILFVDDNTRYTWIFPLQTKDQALKTFIQFKQLVENQFERRIKSLQSDNGGEYRSFSNFLSTHGILHRFTCPYTSAQNGRVERKHRHVVETGLAMLAHASMPLKYWFYAFQAAIYLINRMPTRVLQYVSPYSILFHKNPDYMLMKVFGCLCYPFIRPYNSHKLQFRSVKCLFVGYSPQHKGYMCLDYTSGRVYVTRHVIFDENNFPLKSTAVVTSETNGSHTPALVSSPFFTSPLPTSVPSDTVADSLISSQTLNPENRPNTPSPENSEPRPDLDPSIPIQTAEGPCKMVTRSQHGIFKKKKFFVAEKVKEPTTVKQALKDSNWTTAMDKEYAALVKNNTWDLVDSPPDMNIIGCKWVFKIKYKADGSIDRHKARLVAKGYNQTHGLDYFETFSPVVKPATIRIVLTLALSSGWVVRQLDVQNAFLNGDLEEQVYMSQPLGFVHSSFPHKVCKLRKALYGLKQAPRAWFTRLSNALLSWGFVSSRSDSSMFLCFGRTTTLIVLVYVDDILITGSSNTQIADLVAKLHSSFALRDLGLLAYFLGIEVSYDSKSMHLCQTKYISDLLDRNDMQDCKPAKTPGVVGKSLSQYDGDLFEDPTKYRSVVGALQYVTLTRPDISFAVNKACQFMQSPTSAHWLAVKRILRYLRGTMQDGIKLQASDHLQIQAYTDADYASTPDDRRSSSGYCLYMGENLVSWSATKQKVVSRSSAESEYRGLAIAAAEIVWTLFLLQELCVPQKQTPILWYDNVSASYMASNPVFHARSKHIEIDLHFVRDQIKRNRLQLQYIPSEEQIADLLTKHLSSSRFYSLRSKLCIVPRPFRLRGDESQDSLEQSSRNSCNQLSTSSAS